jgi:hypothetical protein
MRYLLATIAAFGALALVCPIAEAQPRSPDAIAEAIPVEVPEVISGGGWQDGGMNGVYRAIVIVSGAQKDLAARVYVQWIELSANGPPHVVKTAPIKEINDKKFPNAILDIGADAENQAIIIVTTFDPNTQKPTSTAFKATKPGIYQPAPLPTRARQSSVPPKKN